MIDENVMAVYRSARRRLVMPLVLASVLAVGACADLFSTSTVCALGAQAAIRVYIRDAASSALLPPNGTTLILREGAFVDSMTWPSPGGGTWPDGVPISTPRSYERPGIYDVTVQHPGYAQWDTTRIRVREGECGVNTVTLTARLLGLD